MKIVFDARVHLNYYSGISRYIMGVLKAYATTFPEDELIVLINPTIQSDNPLVQSLQGYKQVTLLTVNAGHMGPKNYTKMGKIIRQLKPDLYHYPHLDAPIFTKGIPVVATVHDSNSTRDIKKFDDRFGLKSIYFKWALGMTLKRAKRIIFVSDSIHETILSSYKITSDPQKHIRIYNGFENHFNQITPRNQASELANLKIEGPYLLFVGQIRTHKNIERVLAAFQDFSKENPSFQLVIVGHNYLHLTFDQPHVHYFEKVNEPSLKALYAGCSAFIFPSLFERFGFPILEAFSFGKPVVTSNFGATREISGGLATLVDPYSIDSIREGIRQALEDDKRGNERIAHSKTFGWHQHVKQLRAVYLSVIKST